MSLEELLLQSATKALKKQSTDGSMPAGFNGPHQHSETSVRNTCHWLITFLKVYKITNDKKFLNASEKCINYFLEEKKRYKYNLLHRNFEGRDKCNGLVGPAWTMEALIIASKELKRKDISNLARDIFLLHKFDRKKGLWYRREVTGEILGIDWTFNHQLWFAAIGSMLDKKEYPEVHKQIEVFIKKLAKNFTIYKNGLIWHRVALIPLGLKGIKTILLNIKTLTVNKKIEIYRAIGYQSFNLYGFAILKKNYPDLDFWNSEKLKKAISFLETKEFEKGLEDNKYGFDYNVAGIEVAYILQTFKENSEDLQRYWLEKQFQRNYDFEKCMLSKNTIDPETLSARIYEVTRLNSLG